MPQEEPASSRSTSRARARERLIGRWCALAPHRKAALTRWGGALALAVLTVDWRGQPQLSTDPSWQLGLHYWVNGATDGQPIDFTFGPLGFLSVPTNWIRSTALVAVLFWLVLRVLFAYLVVDVLRQRKMLAFGVVPLWFVLVLSSWAGPAQVLEMLPYVWAAHRWGTVRTAWSWWTVGEGVYCGVVVLIKPGSALVALPILAILNVVTRTGWVARLWSFVLLGTTAAAAVPVGWVAAGQGLGALPRWLHATAALTGGYGAMALEARGRGSDYVWALLGLLILLGSSWLLVGAHRGWALLMGVAFLYLEFKHGFVRHDAHAVGFFLALATALMAPPVAAEARVPRALWLQRVHVLALPVTVLFVLDANPVSFVDLPNPWSAGHSLVSEAATLGSADRWQRERRATQEGMRAEYLISRQVSESLGGGVQVDPWDVAIVWAFDLRWHPVPVFQEYVAFTPWLDGENAKSVLGPDAPSRILRSRYYSTVDGRYGLFDSPAYQLAVECRYHEVVQDEYWQVLGVGRSRCGRWRPLGETTIRQGERLAIPAPSSPASAVVAQVEVQRSLGDRVLDLVFKSTLEPRVCLDASCYRFVVATSKGPLLLRKAGWMPAGPGSDADRRPTTMRFLDLPGRASVQFFEVEGT